MHYLVLFHAAVFVSSLNSPSQPGMGGALRDETKTATRETNYLADLFD